MSENPQKLSLTEKYDARLRSARDVEKLRYDLEENGLSRSDALVAARHTVKNRNVASSHKSEPEKPEQEQGNGNNDQSGGST